MSKIWSFTYDDNLFDNEVPLYQKAGTPIFGSKFKIGDPVYLTDCNSIGFIINGPVNEKQHDEWIDEVKTDVDGNRSVYDLEPLVASHLTIEGVHNPFKDNPEIMAYFKDLGKVYPPKIFQFDWNAGGYGGGIMLVVASSKTAAIEYVKDYESNNWHFSDEVHNLLYTGDCWYGTAFELISSHYQE